MVEAAISITLLLVLTLGFVDFGNAFFQWNAAAKAVQVGARMASVSPPVAPGVKTAGPTAVPGDPIPVYPAANSYRYICIGGDASSCSNYSDANFSRIFRGDTAYSNDDACPAVTAGQRPGMCHFFAGLRRRDVQITYVSSGLGYQTRPGGAVPTIIVEIRPGHPFQFFFLGGLLGFANIDIPPMRSTVTGEDLGDGG
ncbi:TadE/TadG family type IV pilus assembly protein [Mesorhizobium sp. WSM4904]|uniref:TadE/TadG family type IV pilus assembly protein n=1 Tax=Mesorhizobium sp. WSM4904 TaxID=3038545 RepID=UPI0024183B82|nr:TadE/TadG family type IV pilus assembly protein [Mesorhizobium sp. WSM4904]WFP66209.1 TadE/TadG family type IV pilus assembly protein [Mesorhizobium sp. WSM4904]